MCENRKSFVYVGNSLYIYILIKCLIDWARLFFQSFDNLQEWALGAMNLAQACLPQSVSPCLLCENRSLEPFAEALRKACATLSVTFFSEAIATMRCARLRRHQYKIYKALKIYKLYKIWFMWFCYIIEYIFHFRTCSICFEHFRNCWSCLKLIFVLWVMNLALVRLPQSVS